MEDPQGDPRLAVEVFENSGHLPYFEEPEKFVRVVAGFLGNP
jgi:pimeloyl-ACP methyl ester carboxylesterase